MNGSNIGPLLCAALFMLAVGTLIGAIILRAAVAMYNKFVGGPGSVPEPSFGKALGITFVTSIVQQVVGVGIGMAFTMADAAGRQAGGQSQVIPMLISFPVSLLVMAGMLSLLLPTNFGRAILVTICYLVVALLIGLFLALIFGGLALALGLLMRAS